MKLIVLLLVYALLVTNAFAEDMTTKRKKRSESSPSPVAEKKAEPWKPIAFDENVENLPPNYLGIDAKEFYKMFKAKLSSLEKGEFETTEGFRKRTIDKEALIAPINTKDLYAFKIKRPSISYNADDNLYQISTNLEDRCRSTDDEDIGWMTCVIFAVDRRQSSYVGSNAYGASVTISEIKGKDLSLAIHKNSSISNKLFKSEYSYGSDYIISTTLPIPIEKAKTIRNGIDVLFVGRITDARIIKGAGKYHKPKFDFPNDIFISEEALPFEVKQVIYYVSNTGEILKKQSF
ncbi:MAG: hypothetical protein WC007_13095 [Pelobacteraceae bacterium]